MKIFRTRISRVRIPESASRVVETYKNRILTENNEMVLGDFKLDCFPYETIRYKGGSLLRFYREYRREA